MKPSKQTLVALAALAAMGWMNAMAADDVAPGPAPVAAAETPAVAPAAETAPAPGTETPPAVAPVVAPADDQRLIEVPTSPDIKGVEVTGSGNNMITVQLDNVPLPQVISMFTRFSGANIVASSIPSTNVTASLQNVPWDSALRVILDTVGLALVEKDDSIYTIINKQQLAAEPIISETIFLNYSTVSNVLPVVRAMLTSTNASVAAFPASNALIVQETATRLNAIKTVVAQIDKPREQVLIEAKFVELNDQAIKDLGINWQSLDGYTVRARSLERAYTETQRRMDQDAVAIQNTQDRRASAASTTSRDSLNPTDVELNTKLRSNSSSSADILTTLGLSGRQFSEVTQEEGSTQITLVPPFESTTLTTAILSAEEFAVTLSALQQNNGIEVVSNPKIVVASGDTASIHVGTQEPNVVAETQPFGNTAITTYELNQDMPWIEIGMMLKVSPVLNTESNITVRITPELSSKIEDKAYGELGTTFPVLRTRRIETEFQLESGRTVAIGGLTSSGDQERVNKIPLLGDIPVIGKYLFRHTHTEKLQDEVIIFVTVASARPSNLMTISGIPEDGKLIHGYIARKEEEKEGRSAGSKKKPTTKKK